MGGIFVREIVLEALAQLGQSPGRDARAVVRYDEAQRIIPVLSICTP